MKDNHQLGQLTSPLKYHNLNGIYSYRQLLANNYPSNAFLTPVEIFQPWYGHTIANYCLQKKQDSNLKFLEIGGGSGTCALSILDFYKKNHSRSYYSLNYTICEISTVLAEVCVKRLKAAHPELWSSGRIKVVNKSAFDLDTKIKEKVFVIGLEVLDNFAHDKIWRVGGDWKLQTRVDKDLKEVKEEIQDELIIKTLRTYLNMPPKSDIDREAEYREGIVFNLLKYFYARKKSDCLFLPTMTYKLFEHMCGNLEKPCFIFADFDMLPKNKISGINAPIVSRKGKLAHEAQDFDTYLAEFGNVDIFFPVDFRFLQHIHREFKGTSGWTMKSHVFMKEYAKDDWTKMKTGYRPLFDDFLNTSFFVSE